MNPNDFINGLSLDGEQANPEEENSSAGGFLLFLALLAGITILSIFVEREDLGLS